MCRSLDKHIIYNVFLHNGIKGIYTLGLIFIYILGYLFVRVLITYLGKGPHFKFIYKLIILKLSYNY